MYRVAGTGIDDLKNDLETAGFAGTGRFVAVAVALGAVLLGATVPAEAAKRTLKLFNAHTKESLTVTYKKDGKYIPSGLRQLNQFLRDWRRNEATKMDPELFDLIWEVYRKAGGRKPIHVVSAYRSPATNNMLRSRSRGVARNSQHTKGRAMDFFIPGVSLAKLRATGLRKEVGGVGFYPRSGSPFVHMDTGRVRHWPRMTRKQLAKVFPDGKTIHVPRDGKPMPRYKQALAEFNSRKGRASRPVYARETTSDRQRSSRTQLARASKPSALPFDPVQDKGVIATDTRTASSGGGFSGLVSRFTGRDETSPPANIPEPTPASESPPGVSVPPLPAAETEPEDESEPVRLAAVPLDKPRIAPLVAADAASVPNAQQASLVLASADAALRSRSAGVTMPLPTRSGFPGTQDSRIASANPADFAPATLPPSNRGEETDPVEAARSVIDSPMPAARPQIEGDQAPLLAYAGANPVLPLRKSDVIGFVGSVPRPPARADAARAGGVGARQYAALMPQTQTRVDAPPARAMPVIGDLRSLLDLDRPFQDDSRFVLVDKFLTTTTTTRTLVFADLRHPLLRSLGSYMEKPQRVLKTTFAQGFQSELRTDRFTGPAVGVITSIYTP